MYFWTRTKGPLHCQPQAPDSKDSLNESAHSESYDCAMKMWARLFYAAVEQPPGLHPKQTQGTELYTCTVAPLPNSWLWTSFGNTEPYYPFLVSNILHAIYLLLVNSCNFKTALLVSSDKTHTKLEAKTLAVCRILHNSSIDTGSTISFYQNHSRIICFVFVLLYI